MARLTKKTMTAAKRAERDTAKAVAAEKARTGDSYQNFGLNLGVGTSNPLTGSTYGFNPITRNRTLLEWMHRGSWMAKMAVDVVADDMTRAGIDITCDAEPEQLDGVQQDLVSLGVWTGVRDSSAWGRLYGGAIGVIMIDGQDYSTPLNPEKIGKGRFRGIIPLDRWMVEPSLNDLVSEQGPQLGMPKFYRVTSDIPGLRMKIVHYSRVIRFIGAKLPYWQQVSENLWGASVLEALYDRMIAFDSATAGAAQLAYKSYIRTYKIKNLRELIATGGPALQSLYQFVDMMAKFQSIEGITIIDGEDDFIPNSTVNMAGMSEALLQFGQQLSGALQIPLVRMFGQSPAGLNSTGESDLRTYYDGINQQQNTTLMVPMKTIVRAASLSGGWDLPEDFTVTFRPLWQLSEEQKSEVASRDTETVLKAEESGVVSQQTAMKELKQQSKVTGRWTNITDKEIEEASDELAPRGQEAIDQETKAMSDRQDLLGNEEDDEGKNDPKEPKSPKSTKDAATKMSKEAVHYSLSMNNDKCGNCAHYMSFGACEVVKGSIHPMAWCDQWSSRTLDALPISQICGLDIGIESPRGTVRRGVDERGQRWEAVMPADYGFIRRAPSAEGPTEWLDCFVGPDRSEDALCHVIDGYDPDGNFDEHKVMLGFRSPAKALECFHQAYNDGRRAGNVWSCTPDELRQWFTSGDVTRPVGARNLRLAANGT